VVHEEVLTPIVRGDKALALLVAEPLHCSFLGHLWDPPFVFWGPAPTKKPPPIYPGGASIKNKTHLLLPSEHTTDQCRGSPLSVTPARFFSRSRFSRSSPASF
jgi:hypothetical protein